MSSSSTTTNAQEQQANNVISDSWVDLSGSRVSSPLTSPVVLTPTSVSGGGMVFVGGSSSPVRVHTPPLVPLGGDPDYLRMLREAQRETSNRGSAKVSPISSALMSLNSTTRNTPSASPKSPPNSPNNELATFVDDLKDVYVNRSAPEAVAGGGNVIYLQDCRQDEEGRYVPIAEVEGVSEVIWDWSSRPNVPPKEWSLSNSSTDSAKDVDDEKKRSPLFSKGVVYTIIITNIVSLIIGAGFGMWFCKRGGSNMIEIAV